MLDLVLSGGTVVDGSGAPGFSAEVGIAGDRIVAIGDGLQGRQTLDCAGQVIAPGFIDAHSHSDLRILAEPTLPMKLRQGITLEVLGQDGISVAPVRPQEREASRQRLSGLLGDFDVDWDWSTVAEYLGRIEAARPAQDVAYLAPHGALRQWVMGGADREAGPQELAGLQEALRTALDEGACGLSTGLIYPPCCYADTAELIALGQVLAAGGEPLVVHLRSESDHLLDAAQEMVRWRDHGRPPRMCATNNNNHKGTKDLARPWLQPNERKPREPQRSQRSTENGVGIGAQPSASQRLARPAPRNPRDKTRDRRLVVRKRTREQRTSAFGCGRWE